MPDKLKELQDLFYVEAKKNDVLPLDNSTLARFHAAPSPDRGTHQLHLLRRAERRSPACGSEHPGRSYKIEAQVEIPEGGAEGMIVTEGGRFGGYGLFLSKGELDIGRGKVVFLYNLLENTSRGKAPGWKPANTRSFLTSSTTDLASARGAPAHSRSTARKSRKKRWSTRAHHVSGG